MEKVLSKMNWRECLVYIDDVLVWSATFNAHINKLQRIFTTFRAAGLSLKTSKCQILCREVKYLGHMLGTNGLSMDPDRIKAIRDCSAQGQNGASIVPWTCELLSTLSAIAVGSGSAVVRRCECYELWLE